MDVGKAVLQGRAGAEESNVLDLIDVRAVGVFQIEVDFRDGDRGFVREVHRHKARKELMLGTERALDVDVVEANRTRGGGGGGERELWGAAEENGAR